MDYSVYFSLVIGILVSGVLIAIGIFQCRSKRPVGFYTGEKPPLESHIKSVRKWNISHGLLWIGYGTVIILSFLAAAFLSADSLIKTLILFAGTIVPLFLIVAGHHIIKRRLLI